MAIWGPTAKFNSRQYFWLYGIVGMTTTINIAVHTTSFPPDTPDIQYKAGNGPEGICG